MNDVPIPRSAHRKVAPRALQARAARTAAAPEEWEITGAPEVREVDRRELFFTPWPRTYTLAESIANVAAVLSVSKHAMPIRLPIAAVAV